MDSRLTKGEDALQALFIMNCAEDETLFVEHIQSSRKESELWSLEQFTPERYRID